MIKQQNILKVLVLSFFLLFNTTNIGAQEQEYHTKSKKAIKLFEKARYFYNQKQDGNAIATLKEALEADSAFLEAALLIGELYSYQNKYEITEIYYKQACRLGGNDYPLSYLLLGSVQMALKKFKAAESNFVKFLSFKELNQRTLDIGRSELERCRFIINALENPVPFVPENLGPAVNTPYDDYLPSVTADEQILIFTVLHPRSDIPKGSIFHENEDFYISEKNENGEWMPSKMMSNKVNTKNNEGAQSISADGNWLVFTACNREDGFGQCDLYISKRIGDGWSFPKNMGKTINTSFWEAQPSISADGRAVFFSSDRPGAIGDRDIWVSVKDQTGKWSMPHNLGDKINTTAVEISPFIHPDGKTLYFASSGHNGLGGTDLFYSVTDSAGNWTTPVNLGYPINSFKNETGLIVNAQGNRAYYSKKNEDGNADLYTFELYDKVRPTPVTYIKGTVYDAKTKEPIEAEFELIDIKRNRVRVQSASDEQTGRFLVSLPVGKDYALNVSKKGYLFYSENFALTETHSADKPYETNIYLMPITKGERVILKNIFFETDSYELKPQSKAELRKLTAFLNENKNVNIEISGHTDNVGSKTHNQELSENRAKAVYDYLITKKIMKNRLTFAGYADNQPVADNNTDEGRAKNRRTEFKIIKIN